MKNLRVFLQGTGAYQDLVDKWKPDGLFAYASEYGLEARKARATAGSFKFGLVITNLKSSHCECCNKTHLVDELFPCKVCTNLIGDCCQAPYNQFSQIDYNCCTSCYESRHDEE